MPDFPSFTKVSHHESYPSISPDRPDLSAEGRVVLITGAGSGIGQATAIAFAQAKAKAIVVCGRRAEPLEETRAKIHAAVGLSSDNSTADVMIQTVDVSSEEDVERVFGAVYQQYGSIDVVINSAGHLSEAASLRDTTVSNFWDSMEVNVKGAFLVSRAFLRYSTDTDKNDDKTQCVLLLLSSLLAHLPASQVSTAPASYGISKLAAAKLAEYVANENPSSVRAYALHPGVVETEMSDRSIAMAPEGTRQKIVWDHVHLPAHFMLWLASPRGAKAVPSGRFLWVNWDVDELEACGRERLDDDPYLLSMIMGGWPFGS